MIKAVLRALIGIVSNGDLRSLLSDTFKKMV